MSPHTTGVMLVVISAMVFSSAGVFTKAVESGAWEVIFWRGVFAAGFTVAYILWRGSFRQDFVAMGRSGWAVAIIGASGTAAFIPAFKLTTMANVMLIYAAAPLIAALLAWLWIKEHMTRRVMIGCAAAIVGVAIIVQGSFGATNLRGDLLALWMTIAMSTVMVIYRRFPGTPAAGPAAMSSIVLLPLGMMYGDPFAIPLYDFAVLAAFGLIFAIASVTLAEGVKRIPAGETALLSALETPLAPLFGWFFFMEIPASTTFLGGVIILVAVLSTQIKSSTGQGE
ncbi:MAG: DMT family transporter [Rhodospirillales bacterium]|nr:DMT family transporter [Rhodospirillales bacterium]MBT4041825.1 DMT family transporter [Rhodospirillales bacterium]MBT4625854.1 DMT family transporter [Rhodospirillales bacterium]MBT5351638.1 DMT family transporter [Rhodospirillales bacterium]MBT5520958.1 DMT family transporter [Rhodospirillales bacterium]